MRDDWGEGDAGEGGEGAGGGEFAAEGEGLGGGGVNVFFQDTVGPFDAVVLAADDPGALLTWLVANGYDIPPETGALLAPYIGDSHFLAMRLTKGAEAGDIRPIVLTFEDAQPMIPIRLTAVAAADDMPIRVWFIGGARAVPTNWRHVVPNLARLPWYGECGWWGGCLEAWPDLVGDAVDEAGGRGFVTNFAGGSAGVADFVPRPDEAGVDRLRQLLEPWVFLDSLMLTGVPRDAALLGIFRRFIPKPDLLEAAGVSDNQFYNCLRCFRADIEASGLQFDPDGLADAILDEVVRPLVDLSDRLRSGGWITSLYSQLSPNEMTEDPVFTFNEDLEGVSRLRSAVVVTECEPDILRADATTRPEGPQGQVLHVRGSSQPGRWNYAPDPALPAALRVETMNDSGPGEIDIDNTAVIAARLSAASDAQREALDDPPRYDSEDLSCDWPTCRPGTVTGCFCPTGAVGVRRCDSVGVHYGSCHCEDPSDNGGGPLCTPGAQAVCRCRLRQDGVQTCDQDGQSYGSCVCGQPRPESDPDPTPSADPPVESDLDPSPVPGSQPVCVPGRSVACRCPAAVDSIQVCQADCTRFSTCACDAPAPSPWRIGSSGPDAPGQNPVGCEGCALPGSQGGGLPPLLATFALLGLLASLRRGRTRGRGQDS